MADRHAVELIEIRLKPKALKRLGLPDILYPLPFHLFSHALDDEAGHLQYGALLRGLQLRGAQGDADWQALEPAMERLTSLLAPGDERPLVSAAGESWWLEIGQVELDAPLVTIQRQQELIAALCPRKDGSLRLGAYRPLDARSASLIIGLALRPHPDDGTVCMRANNWEYALDCSAATGQFYAFSRGEAHLTCWEHGLGIMQDGTLDPAWRGQRPLVPRAPARVAMELGVAFAFGD